MPPPIQIESYKYLGPIIESNGKVNKRNNLMKETFFGRKEIAKNIKLKIVKNLNMQKGNMEYDRKRIKLELKHIENPQIRTRYGLVI